MRHEHQQELTSCTVIIPAQSSGLIHCSRGLTYTNRRSDASWRGHTSPGLKGIGHEFRNGMSNRIVELLARNLREEDRLDQNIRLWMQASRFQEMPPSVEDVFEQVQYWRAEPGSVDAEYYAYVLNALMAMDGSRLALQRHEQSLKECKELTRFRRNRDRSYEWLSDGPGISRLVHQSRLGDWDRDRGFWKNTAPLTRVRGRVTRINGPQAWLH